MNWKAAAVPLLAVAFLAYSEIKKDWDDNPNTNSDFNIVLVQAGVVSGILFGTTTVRQTEEIAQKKVEENA
jgi:hypothetical protein